MRDLPAKVNAKWLTECLRANGFLAGGDVTAIVAREAHKHHFALTVDYTDSAFSATTSKLLPRDLILKWYEGGYPHGVNEAFFFEQLAPLMPSPPLPNCYDAGFNRETCEAHVLLADMSESHFVAEPPYMDLTLQQFEQLVDTHALMHTFWWDHPKLSHDDILNQAGVGVAHEAISVKTIRQNQQYFTEQVVSARIAKMEGKLRADLAPLLPRIVDSWAEHFILRLANGNGLTLIQGDAQLGNMLLPRDPAINNPIIIDWEGCTRGLGVWDLARTLIQTEYPSAKRHALEIQLLQRYVNRLSTNGISDYSLDDCHADYCLSVLANIPHALSYESDSYLESVYRAYQDWNCVNLLS